MVEAVLKVIWNLVIGNLGRIKDMVTGWADKMKLAWEHRGEIADEFLKKWNAETMWDRGMFQGEVLGWVAMTVLLILVTMGEDAPAALSGIAVRWPQLVKLLKTVDTLGDVTTYLGAAAKAVKLPGRAAELVAGKLGRAERAVEHVAEDVGKDASRAGKKAENAAAYASHEAAAPHTAKERGPEHTPDGPDTTAEILKVFRRAKKIRNVEAVSLKRLRLALGQAGAMPGKYKLVRATEKELHAVGGEVTSVFGWVALDGADTVARDARGRPIITFTPRGLASLEEAVKTFGHEVQHLKDFAAGVATSSEDFAEEAGDKLWLAVQAKRKH